MNLKRLTIIIFVLSLAVLSAQTNDATLSLQQARELALQNNSAYQAKAAELEAAKWSKTSAISSILPSMSLDGTWLYMDPAQTVQAGGSAITLNHDFRTFGLSLTQPIFVGGKAWQGYQMEKLGESMAQTGLEAQKLTLLTEVNNNYLGLLQTQDLTRISEMDKRSAEINLQIAQLKFDNGLLSNADYLRFKSQLASKEVTFLQAQTARQLAQLNLRNYLGIDFLPVAEELPGVENDPVMETLNGYSPVASSALSELALQRSQEANTSLRLLENGVELSRRSYQMSKGSFLPTVMLIGSLNFEENGIDRYKFDSSSQIMLTASIPLLPQLGNYAAMRKANFEYKKTLLQAKTATDGIKLGTESAVLNLVSAAKQVQAAGLSLEFTQQTYEQLQERFRMNLISSKDLLDADLMLSASRVAYSNAVFAYHKARVSLMQILGLENAEDLDTMIIIGANK